MSLIALHIAEQGIKVNGFGHKYRGQQRIGELEIRLPAVQKILACVQNTDHLFVILGIHRNTGIALGCKP